MKLSICIGSGRHKTRNPISKILAKLKLRELSKKTNIQIPSVTKIGEGFCVSHCGRIIINPRAVLGKI